MKSSMVIIAIPILFVCAFFYLGTEESLHEAMPWLAITRCMVIALVLIFILGISTLISHLCFRHLFNKEIKRKILLIETLVYLIISIPFMWSWLRYVF